MAVEGNHRLEDNALNGYSRRFDLNQILGDVPRPFYSDAWIIMNEAEGLREYLGRRV